MFKNFLAGRWLLSMSKKLLIAVLIAGVALVGCSGQDAGDANKAVEPGLSEGASCAEGRSWRWSGAQRNHRSQVAHTRFSLVWRWGVPLASR